MKALSRQDVAALQEGDVVLVRMEVRKPLGEHGEDTWRSHYVPVFPELIVAKDAESKEVPSSIDVRCAPSAS
jgi:hypothetical protein